MLTNAKHYIIIIAVSLLIGFGVSYAWNNQTLSEMVEEHNQQILSDCLTKARIQKTAKEILEYASNCNKDILTNLSAPRSVETIEPSKWEIECLSQFKDENEQFTCWMSGSDYLKNKPAYKLQWHSSEKYFIEFKNKYWTHSTGNTVQPLWFQLIPQASAKSVEIKNDSAIGVVQNSYIDAIGIQSPNKIRTPKQIYEQVKHLGYREQPTISLIQSCKASSRDPRHCLLVGLTLLYNEAGNQQNSKACTTRNNCFWVEWWRKVYSSLDEWMENFVQKYNKWWINVKSAEDFYPDLWKLSKTRYCYSETQHHPNIGCPDGQKIAQSKWNQLTPIIYE